MSRVCSSIARSGGSVSGSVGSRVRVVVRSLHLGNAGAAVNRSPKRHRVEGFRFIIAGVVIGNDSGGIVSRLRADHRPRGVVIRFRWRRGSCRHSIDSPGPRWSVGCQSSNSGKRSRLCGSIIAARGHRVRLRFDCSARGVRVRLPWRSGGVVGQSLHLGNAGAAVNRFTEAASCRGRPA